MFLVRAFRDGADGRRERLVTIDRLEEKMGQHASATAALRFDRTPAELVGQPGGGFRQMLELINHARIGVGFESIGLCEAALRLARAYASERRSMDRTIDRHELIADYLDEMEIDVIGLRALAMHAAFEDEIGHKKALFGRFLPGADAAQLAREAEGHRAAARRATPLLKYLAAEKAVELSRRCLQIHGGVGYMREYGAEKLVRDALVMPIYEGTSQIQSLMATKDTLTAIMRAPQDLLKRHAQARWRALSARDPLERRVARLQQLSLAAQQHVITRTLTDKVRAKVKAPKDAWIARELARGRAQAVEPAPRLPVRAAARRAPDAPARRRGDRGDPRRSGAPPPGAPPVARALPRTRAAARGVPARRDHAHRAAPAGGARGARRARRRRRERVKRALKA